MRCASPVFLLVTRRAEPGSAVVHAEKLSIPIIVRVMARRALHLLATVQRRVFRERRWIGDLPLLESEGCVIDERDGVIVREISSQR